MFSGGGPPAVGRLSSHAIANQEHAGPVDLRRLSRHVGRRLGVSHPEDLVEGSGLIPLSQLTFVRHVHRGALASTDEALLRDWRGEPVGSPERDARTGALHVAVIKLRSAAYTMRAICMFVREQQVLLRLQCDYIMGRYGLGVGRPEREARWPSLFAVAELATDGSLRDALEAQAEDPLNHVYGLDEALDWAIDVAGALSFLHSPGVGIIHRDLRSANVLLVRDPRTEALTAKLAGFKLYCSADGTPTLCDDLADDEWRRGLAPDAFLYRAPEAEDDAELGPQPPADVFSLGAVMHEMFMRRSLSGALAAQGGWSREEYEHQFAAGFRVPLTDRLPKELRLLILACLEWDPADRPTAGQVLRVLHTVRAGGAILHADKLVPHCGFM